MGEVKEGRSERQKDNVLCRIKRGAPSIPSAVFGSGLQGLSLQHAVTRVALTHKLQLAMCLCLVCVCGFQFSLGFLALGFPASAGTLPGTLVLCPSSLHVHACQSALF